MPGTGQPCCPGLGQAFREAACAQVAPARSLLAHPRIAFPLAVAQVLLSGLLVVASGLAMGGRRGGTNRPTGTGIFGNLLSGKRSERRRTS